MIYLASPYSDPDPAVREWRFQEVCRAAAQMIAEGQMVLSPIVHCHPIALMGNLPLDWQYWERYTMEILPMCVSMTVLMLPGWVESKGVSDEILIAQRLEKPVIYRFWETEAA